MSLYNPNKLSVKCFTCRDVTLFAGILFIGLDSCRTMSIWSPGSEAEKTAYFSTQLASSSFWEKYRDTQIRSHKLGRNIVKIWDPNSICQYPYQFLVGRKRNLEKLNSEVFIYSGAFPKSVHRLHECWWRRKSPHPFFYFANSTGKSLFLGDLLTKKKTHNFSLDVMFLTKNNGWFASTKEYFIFALMVFEVFGVCLSRW